jgi:hypothetical protein
MISGKNKTGIPADRNYLLHLNNLVHYKADDSSSS